MLLAIDVGNTHVVLGLFEDEELRANWRLQSDTQRTVDEYALEILALLQFEKCTTDLIHQVVISCVVPSLSRVFNKLSEKYFSVHPLLIGANVRTAPTGSPGIIIRCDDPRMVGPDRIVNAVAAKELFGAPAIVVDFGTATTFDVVGKEGNYEGGAIAPGLLISADALFERAALLPSIELKKPPTVIGKNTIDSMLSGIIYGYVGLVDGILERMLESLGKETTVIATGGLSQMISAESRYIKEALPDLTLIGLKLIASYNR